MTPKEIGKRFSAHPRWRWLPGMRRLDGARLIAVDEALGLLWADEEDGLWWSDHSKAANFTPDLTDPVTVMACLVWLREMSGRPHLCTTRVTIGDGWVVTGFWCVDSIVRATEAGAILAAAEELL